ncbi:MAG: hypothetical protein IJI98_09075 [Methanosphaera sp.]|nr:hypothetical protein [Methanosphaera sp.]
MDKKIGAIIATIIIVILCIMAYIALVPSYKAVEMSGYQMEVPQSTSNVDNKTENYNTYDDTGHNLSIKTWSWKNTQDQNLNGCYDIGAQLGSNLGQNCTHENITLYNKSGTYTYYDYNAMTGSMIVITTKELETITHIIDTMKKSEIRPDMDLGNFTNMALGLTAQNNTTTNNTTTTTNTKKASSTKTKKTSNTKSSSSQDTIYGEKIDERHDFAGNPDYEYIGTQNNIYIREKKTGKTAKRYLDGGAYYFK